MALTLDNILGLCTWSILSPSFSLSVSLVILLTGHETSSTTFRASLIYLFLLTLSRIFAFLDARLVLGNTSRGVHWSEEVVVITGGAGAIGSLLAQIFGARGVATAVLDIHIETSARRAEWATKGCSYYSCDVGDRAAVETVKTRIEEEVRSSIDLYRSRQCNAKLILILNFQLGIPTILINNAAVVHGKSLLSLTPSDVSATFRTNVLAHFNTLSVFLPAMLRRPHGGTIVTLSSVLGALGCAGLADYTASKAAVTALHRSLDAELALLATQDRQDEYPASIRTVLVAPGHVATPLFARIQPTVLSAFLGPVVEPRALVMEIVKAVDAGVSAEVALPAYARWIAWFGVLPRGIKGVVRNVAGLDDIAWRGFGMGKEQ